MGNPTGATVAAKCNLALSATAQTYSFATHRARAFVPNGLCSVWLHLVGLPPHPAAWYSSVAASRPVAVLCLVVSGAVSLAGWLWLVVWF